MMIDIYTGDTVFPHVRISFQSMMLMMRDGIGIDGFMEFEFEDGEKGAIRVDSITGFTESMQEV